MRAGGGAAQHVVDAIGERFGTTGTDLNDGLVENSTEILGRLRGSLHPPPRGSPPCSPRPSLAFPTVLPTVLHWVLLVTAPFVSSAR